MEIFEKVSQLQNLFSSESLHLHFKIALLKMLDARMIRSAVLPHIHADIWSYADDNS